MTSIDPAQLPAPSSISHPEVRAAVSNVQLAKHELDEARKSKVQAELELPAAHEKDAADDEAKRSKGEAKLKGRPATQKAEKEIADLTHEELVAEKALRRTRQELETALDQYGDAFIAEQDDLVEKLDHAWDSTIPALVKLANERSAAVRVLKQLGGTHPAVAMIQLGVRDLGSIEIPAGGSKVADVFVETILTALESLGHEPVPEPEVEPQKPVNLRRLENVENAGVEGEIDERRRFLAEVERSKAEAAA